MEISFVAGFGPIPPDPAGSVAFWGGALGLDLDEVAPDYFHAAPMDGVRVFGIWPLAQAAEATTYSTQRSNSSSVWGTKPCRRRSSEWRGGAATSVQTWAPGRMWQVCLGVRVRGAGRAALLALAAQTRLQKTSPQLLRASATCAALSARRNTCPHWSQTSTTSPDSMVRLSGSLCAIYSGKAR